MYDYIIGLLGGLIVCGIFIDNLRKRIKYLEERLNK